MSDIPAEAAPAECCAGCRYAVLSPSGPECACRRYPPTVVKMDAVTQNIWPKTEVSMWCGEFRPKPSLYSSDAALAFAKAFEYKGNIR